MTGMEIPAGLRNHAGCTSSKTGFQEISTIHASSSRETALSSKLGHRRFLKADEYRLDRKAYPKAVVHPPANFASEGQNVPVPPAPSLDPFPTPPAHYTIPP